MGAFASKRKAQCTTNESVKRKRASESEKETDKVRRATRRACETIKQTLHRNRMHMASVRGSETCEQTLHRQEQLAFPKIIIPLSYVIICTTNVHAEGLHFSAFHQH